MMMRRLTPTILDLYDSLLCFAQAGHTRGAFLVSLEGIPCGREERCQLFVGELLSGASFVKLRRNKVCCDFGSICNDVPVGENALQTVSFESRRYRSQH
jgi:hypothetical protein